MQKPIDFLMRHAIFNFFSSHWPKANEEKTSYTVVLLGIQSSNHIFDIIHLPKINANFFLSDWLIYYLEMQSLIWLVEIEHDLYLHEVVVSKFITVK